MTEQTPSLSAELAENDQALASATAQRQKEKPNVMQATCMDARCMHAACWMEARCMLDACWRPRGRCPRHLLEYMRFAGWLHAACWMEARCTVTDAMMTPGHWHGYRP